jgi:hypothetical protein
MAASWPAGLPGGFLEGTDKQTGEDNLLRSAMDVGPAKVRRRTTAGAGILEGTLMLDQGQFDLFLQFWRTTTRAGALAFSFYGVALFRFRQAPSWTTVRTALGPHYQVTMNLEVLP